MLTTTWSGRIDHRGLECQEMSVRVTKQGHDGEEVGVGRHILCSGNRRKSVRVYYRDFEARDNSHQD